MHGPLWCAPAPACHVQVYLPGLGWCEAQKTSQSLPFKFRDDRGELSAAAAQVMARVVPGGPGEEQRDRLLQHVRRGGRLWCAACAVADSGSGPPACAWRGLLRGLPTRSRRLTRSCRAVGPYLIGYLSDHYGGFAPPMYLLGAFNVLAGLMIIGALHCVSWGAWRAWGVQIRVLYSCMLLIEKC